MKINELFKKTSVKMTSVVLAAALVFGSSMYAIQLKTAVPELVSFVDADGSVEITEDEVPLASAPKVTKTTNTKKTTKKVTMKTAATKTYNKKGATQTTKRTSKVKSSTATTTTETVTAVTTEDQYKKGSKVDTQVTTTTTTVTKTVVSSQAAASGSANPAIKTIAPKAPANILKAYNDMGFKVTIKSNASYAGLFDARTRTITLKKADATSYHELGHFTAFVAGNVDTGAAFKKVFAAEKSKYTAANKAYVLQNSSEYFAESFKNYVENGASLKKERPQTYAAVDAAVKAVTTDRTTKLMKVYGSVWK